MRYTHKQYNAIITDAERTIKKIEADEDLSSRQDIIKYPFMCSQTACSFCPVESCASYHTTMEWRTWLAVFTACNDPDRPYTVEIPADVVDVIDTALHIETLNSDTRDLLRLIQKQINDENRN